MRENTIQFWGTLDVAVRTVEDIPQPFQQLWDKAEYRMRPDDVKRLKKYLTRMAVAEKKVKATLKLFEGLNKK